MKLKIVGLLFVFCFLALSTLGCSSSTSSTTTLPAATAAGSLGDLAVQSLAADNGVLGVITSLGISSPTATSPSSPTYEADGWWTSTDGYSLSGYTYVLTYRFKLWDLSSNEVTTLAGLQSATSSTISKLWICTSLALTYSGNSYTFSMGTSISDPLKFENYNSSTTKSIDGPMQMVASYSSNAYTITYDYDNLTLSSSGYPSGTITFSITGSSYTPMAGRIVFDGTSPATLTFTGALSGSYAIDLDTGDVTAASID